MPWVSAYLSGFYANHKEAVSLTAEADSLQRGDALLHPFSDHLSPSVVLGRSFPCIPAAE